MATGQNIIDNIRDELQDATDLSVDDAVLLRYINRGAKEFCAFSGALQAMANIDTDNTNFKFTLSASLSNLVEVFQVQFNGTPLSRTFVHEVTYKFGASSGTPDQTTAWYVLAGVLYIAIIPPTATGDSALNVAYFRTPTEMSAVSDTFDFPAEYEPAIVAYGVARARYADRDTLLSSSEMATYFADREGALNINKNKLLGDVN
jgi:hypothetical protein